LTGEELTDGEVFGNAVFTTRFPSSFHTQ